MWLLFAKGFLIGLAIAAPVGPIGVLCIQRSLHHGFKIGLMTGLGAALADGTFGICAATGLTAISTFLITHQQWMQGLGGLFLIYLGIKLFLAQPPQSIKLSKSERSAWHALGTTFVLTLMNPVTILSFIAIFAGLGLGTAQPDWHHAALLVFGITLGSAAWWLILSSGVAFVLHHFLSIHLMQSVNRCSGGVLFVFGVVALCIR